MDDKDIIYSALFVDDKEALKKAFPSKLPNKYYDHCTLYFRPSLEFAGIEHVGERRPLHIIGRLITDKADVLVVDPRSLNLAHCQLGRYMPHITLAMADGIPPKASGEEVYNYKFDVKPFRYLWQDLILEVDTTRGVFTADKGIITNPKELWD